MAARSSKRSVSRLLAILLLAGSTVLGQETSPILKIEEKWHGYTVFVILTTKSPALTTSLRMARPRLKCTVTRDGTILNLRSATDYDRKGPGASANERQERWAMELVRKWYQPSHTITRLAKDVEIYIYYTLSQ